MSRIAQAAIAGSLLYLAFLSPAYAYIDPGSGSMIMTTILGVVAAIGYTARKQFYRLKSLFKQRADR